MLDKTKSRFSQKRLFYGTYYAVHHSKVEEFITSKSDKGIS